MKKLIFLFLFILPLIATSQTHESYIVIEDGAAFENSSSQAAINLEKTKDYYLQKGERLNKTGWTLLGVGTAMIIVGAVGFDENFQLFEEDKGSDTKADMFGFMLLGGIILDLASIPVFISASQNKKMAISLAISQQNIYLQQSNSSFRINPTLSINVTF